MLKTWGLNLKVVCYLRKEVQNLENLKRQEMMVVRKGGKLMEIKISQVKKLGIMITCRLWSWVVGVNIIIREIKTRVCN